MTDKIMTSTLKSIADLPGEVARVTELAMKEIATFRAGTLTLEKELASHEDALIPNDEVRERVLALCKVRAAVWCETYAGRLLRGRVQNKTLNGLVIGSIQNTGLCSFNPNLSLNRFNCGGIEEQLLTFDALCACDLDAAVKHLERLVFAVNKSDGLSTPQRIQRIAELKSQLEERYRVDEEMTDAAIAAGLKITHCAVVQDRRDEAAERAGVAARKPS